MTKEKILILAVLIGDMLLSSFHSAEVNLPSPTNSKQSGYIVAVDSLTNIYLAKNTSPHNRMWNLHQILVNRLRKSGVDTVLFYQSGCFGCEVLPTRDEMGKPSRSCQCAEDELVVCLFWRDKGKTFSKKLDCCQNQPVATAKPAIIDFYFQNRTHFQAGEKFFRDFEAYNRNHPKAGKFLPPTSVHDDVDQVLFYLDKKRVQFQVRKGEFTSSGNPRYLRYTWKRKQWEWTKLIEKSIAKK